MYGEISNVTVLLYCHGVFNHLVLATCGLVLMYAAVESLGIGYIMAAAECELKLSHSEKGWVNAAAFIGIMITAIVWGYLSDQFGRRTVMLPSMALATVVSFASSFAISFWYMFIMRFLTGCLVSASSATVYAYLGEMHSNARRDSVVAFTSTFISVTFITTPLLAWIIVPRPWSFTVGSITIVPWRVFMWSWCVPGLVAAIILVFLPESPRYLFAMKGEQKAVKVLAKMYAWNFKKKKEDYPVTSITVTKAIAQRSFIGALQNAWLLLRPPLGRCVIISHFSMFMVFLLTSGLYTWMPSIVNEMLNKIDQPVTLCTVMRNKRDEDLGKVCKQEKMHNLLYPVSIAMGALCALTYIACGFIVRKFNKIRLYCVLLVVCSLIIAISSVIPQLIVALVFLIVGLTSGCSASVLTAIAVEVFPTNVRALALCTMYMSGRLGAAVGANLLGTFLQKNCVAVLMANSLITAASTVLLFFWPDPKAVRADLENKGFVY